MCCSNDADFAAAVGAAGAAGPPGCGKSTTVRLLAQERGMEVVEWAAPTPTTWEEYKYQVRVLWAALPVVACRHRIGPGSRHGALASQEHNQTRQTAV
jgi:hypothetical protein